MVPTSLTVVVRAGCAPTCVAKNGSSSYRTRARLARDSVQNGRLDILRGLPRLRDEGLFAAWAFRIITRKCAKLIANLQNIRKTLNAVSAEQSHDAPRMDDTERLADSKPVHEALARRPVEQRTAVALVIPAGTVESAFNLLRTRSLAADPA